VKRTRKEEMYDGKSHEGRERLTDKCRIIMEWQVDEVLTVKKQ
jgi:hypothetical protein